MIDIHEVGTRRENYAKNAADELFLTSFNEHLAKQEFLVETAGNGADIPVIYIVGAPRSGTTLLSQVISKFLPVGYIDNLIARFWLRPSVGIRLSSVMLGKDSRRAIDFASKHGVTEGLAGPHEFGYFWSHGFRLNQAKTHHLTLSEIARLDKTTLKASIEKEILAQFDRPVVFKNVTCGFQAPLLTELHENSLFIHISRDIRATCASILKLRFDRYGDYSTWWSLKPSTFEKLPKDPVRQVVQQVRDCRSEIQRQINQSGAHALEVTYEELCMNPNAVLKMVSDKLAFMGAPISDQGICPPFSPGKCSWLPDHLMAQLDAEISNLL